MSGPPPVPQAAHQLAPPPPSAGVPSFSAAAPGELAVATRGLVKSYGRHRALMGLDMSVPRGQVYGFLGPNGSGKTTALRLLTGLIRPNAGSIWLFGQPYSWHDRKRLFRVGSLIETPSFYPYLSGRENLVVLGATGPATAPGRIEQVLDYVGMSGRARDPVQTYSMGMKQRLGIAAAMLSDPDLLLLDEPANGLDPGGMVAMRETLRYFTEQLGKTVVLSSHLLHEIQQLADVVGIIDRGRLIREGPLDTLLEDSGRVRVRVTPAEMPSAAEVLTRLAPDRPLYGIDSGDEAGWFTVNIAPGRASEVSHALADAGLYPSGLEPGSDLETLFLQLTSGGAVVDPPSPPQAPLVAPGATAATGGSLMRLIRAELLKARRRSATYIVLVVAVVITAAVYLLIGGQIGGFSGLVEFPGAYALADQFVFGLGGLLAIIYAAAFAGADWNWGVVRNVVARGESRTNYLLGKAGALAIIIAAAMLLLFAFCMLMTYVIAGTSGVAVASPLRGRGLQDLFDNLALGYPVLLEQASVGFAVAVVMRSQLAGAVVGVVLYVGEKIVTTVLTLLTLATTFRGGDVSGGLPQIGPEWFQYLPISIGGYVTSAAPGGSTGISSGGLEGFFLRPVPLAEAFTAVLIYLVVAIVASILAFRRQEIV